VTENALNNGQIPIDPTTAIALLITFCITKALPADQIGAAAIVYPFVHRLLATERR
jgi:hypothetical protein